MEQGDEFTPSEAERRAFGDRIAELEDTEVATESGDDEPVVSPESSESDLTTLDGVGESTAENLRNAGFGTVDDVTNASRDDLVAVDGVGEALADDLTGGEG